MLSKKRFTIVGTNLQHALKIHFRGIVITHLQDKSVYLFTYLCKYIYFLIKNREKTVLNLLKWK